MRNKYSLFFLLFSFTGFAQIQISSDVYAAVQLALDKNVDLKNQTLELEKLELERKGVLNKFIPRVEATALYGYLNMEGNLDIPTMVLPITGIPLFAGSSDFSAKGQVFHGGVMAKTILFSGGQITNGAKALQYKSEGNSYIFDLKRDEVIKDMLTSFDQMQLLKAADVLIDDSEKRLNKETERVEKAISLGLAIPYDRDKIKLATLELHSKRTDVNHKQELLALKISQATGLPTTEIRALNHWVDVILVLDELTTENRNEIKALESFKTASEYAMKKEKGTLLPSLGAFGGYSYSSIFNGSITAPVPVLETSAKLKMDHLNLNPNWMVGVAMKWELFSGFERKHKIEEAELSTKQVDNKLQDTKELLMLQLTKNMLTYQTALQQVEIAKQGEKIAQNNNTLAEKQYRAGLMSITDRLASENDIYNESLKRIETIIKQRQAAIDAYQSAGPLEKFIEIKK